MSKIAIIPKVIAGGQEATHTELQIVSYKPGDSALKLKYIFYDANGAKIGKGNIELPGSLIESSVATAMTTALQNEAGSVLQTILANTGIYSKIMRFQFRKPDGKPATKVIEAEVIPHAAFDSVKEAAFVQLGVEEPSMQFHPNTYWKITPPNEEPENEPAGFIFSIHGPQYNYTPRLTALNKYDYTEWQGWMSKNNLVKPYPMGGHVWQSIAPANAAIFAAHPEYRALVGGVRTGSQLCVGNADLRQLFFANRKAAWLTYNNPNAAVTVEPADGDGFCEDALCAAVATTKNDQPYYLANETAAYMVAQGYPNAKVNLLAYYSHPSPPAFDLHPNVHVTVTPFGFHYLYGPEEILMEWADKANHKTWYEYWNIPQWHGELPIINMHDFIVRRNIAQAKGYEGFWFESGCSLVASIALNLFNQLNDGYSWTQVFERFLTLSFPQSYTPMKRLWTRWMHTWDDDNEVKNALYDLQAASALATNANELERIADCKAYVHYIRLYLIWSADRTIEANTTALFDWVVQSGRRMIVNGNALYNLFQSYMTTAQKAKYSITAQNFSWAGTCTKEDIETLFLADVAAVTPVLSTFTFTEVADAVEQIKASYTLKTTHTQETILTMDRLYYYLEGNSITINVTGGSDNRETGIYIGIVKVDGSYHIRHKYMPGSGVQTLAIDGDGVYVISFSNMLNSIYTLTAEAVIPVLNNDQFVKHQVRNAAGTYADHIIKPYHYITAVV